MTKWTILVLGVLSLPVVAFAQISSDQVPQGRQVPLRESVESAMSESRWKWGPLRVEPTLKLGNIGYNANVFGDASNETDDFTATVGAGVRTIMPIGPKTFLRFDVVPQYTWYYELEDQRRLGWEARGAFLALFNRMQLEAEVSSNDTVDIVNSEELTPTGQRTDKFIGNLEIDVLKRLALFVGAEVHETDLDPAEENDANLELLDRREELERVGLRYKFRPDVNVYGMYEQTHAEFPNDEVFTENDGEAVLLGFSYDRPRFYLNVVGGQRTIEYVGEGAPTFDDFTGSGFLAFRVFRRSELGLTFHAKPVYSTFVENPYFYETRGGIRLGVPMGDQLVVLGEYEQGKNDYQQPIELPDGGVVFRVDDTERWSAGLGFQLKSGVALDVRYTIDRYESNLDGFSRDVPSVQMSLRTSILTITAR